MPPVREFHRFHVVPAESDNSEIGQASRPQDGVADTIGHSTRCLDMLLRFRQVSVPKQEMAERKLGPGDRVFGKVVFCHGQGGPCVRQDFIVDPVTTTTGPLFARLV